MTIGKTSEKGPLKTIVGVHETLSGPANRTLNNDRCEKPGLLKKVAHRLHPGRPTSESIEVPMSLQEVLALFLEHTWGYCESQEGVFQGTLKPLFLQLKPTIRICHTPSYTIPVYDPKDER